MTAGTDPRGRGGRLVPVALAAVALVLGAALAACSSGGGGSDVTLTPAGERGKQVAREQGCISCHTADGSKSTGPSWQGLYGKQVELEDGTVTADDAYITQSILQPRSQVVKGYPNIMPVYDGEVTKAEIADLIAYIRDLSPDAAATTTSTSTTADTTSTTAGDVTTTTAAATTNSGDPASD